MFEIIGCVFMWQFWIGVAITLIFHPLISAGLKQLFRKND